MLSFTGAGQGSLKNLIPFPLEHYLPEFSLRLARTRQLWVRYSGTLLKDVIRKPETQMADGIRRNSKQFRIFMLNTVWQRLKVFPR